MAEQGKSGLGVYIAFGAWALAFALSVALAAGTEPVGDGFARGLNRIGTFFRWQFLAFALAIVTWTIARGRSDLPRGVQRLAWVPIGIQCFLGLAGVVVVVLAVVLD